MSYWGQKTFCLITGASRGIGATIAVEFAKKVGPGSVFLLVARSLEALEGTKASILLATQDSSSPPSVFLWPMDLGAMGAKKEDFKACVTSTGVDTSTFDHSILVHNAGSVGNVSLKVTQMEDPEELQAYWNFNLTSVILLTSHFLSLFSDKGKQRSVVQITSLAGIQPFKSWGYYCAGKAGRDMLMKVLSLEEGEGLQVLSYAPGPVDTEMYSLVGQETGDPETKALLKTTKDSGLVLTPLRTVSRLVGVLESKRYVRGEHIDYFEVDDQGDPIQQDQGTPT